MKNANPVSRRRTLNACAQFSLLAGALLIFTGCEPRGSHAAQRADKTMSAPKTAADFFPIKVGAQTVRMQLAVQEAEMARGLMGRRDLAESDGMIFVFREPGKRSFYMRNTPTPLDIGYFTRDGVLREIYPMHPFDETTVPSRSGEIQFALEMNQGWFQRHGVRPGERLDLVALAAALRARGFSPRVFGLEEKTPAP